MMASFVIPAGKVEPTITECPLDVKLEYYSPFESADATTQGLWKEVHASSDTMFYLDASMDDMYIDWYLTQEMYINDLVPTFYGETTNFIPD
jgi:hypothetical protein